MPRDLVPALLRYFAIAGHLARDPDYFVINPPSRISEFITRRGDEIIISLLRY
jgi:hypothetical protein